MSSKALSLGISAVKSVLPWCGITILWSWAVFFGLVLGVLKYDTIPQWANGLMLIPILVSPAKGAYGVIYGLTHRTEERAWLGVLLSVLGIVLNALLWGWLDYFVSRY